MLSPLHILAISLIAISCASSSNKSLQQAEIHYNHGTENLINKEYTVAVTHLIKAATLNPKNADIHNNLGMAYYFKQEKELALEHIRRAVELDPKHTDARVNLASMLFEAGDLREAEKNYLSALKDVTYEKHARTYYNLALIELRRNQPKRALAHLNAAVKEEEGYCPAWFQKGMLSYKTARYEAAAKEFHQARLGACVKDPAPLYWLAATDIELGKFLSARMKLDELTTSFPKSSYANLANQKLSEITLRESKTRYQKSETNVVEPETF